MISGGYRGYVIRIDLSSRSIKKEGIDREILEKYLGGRGLAAKYYFHEVDSSVEPLSEDNKIIFMTGPLTGTPVYSSTKFQLATKSPLTRHYLCSNSGGNFGPQLKFSGYDGLIIEGKSKTPVYISIFDDEIRLNDASDLMGLDTEEVTEKLKKVFNDPRLSVMSVGPAAENLVNLACIQVDGRSFGRGGAGAVMVSKNLKAVVVKGSSAIPLADQESLDSFIKGGMKKLRESKAGLTQYGTCQLTEVINSFSCYPTRNFQQSEFEGIDKISATHMVEHYKVKNSACYRCPIACAQVCEVKEGPFKGAKSDPEFETVGALGGQCGVSDFDAIIAANMYCDKFGLDTMETGTLIAFAMELYERGLINKEDTGGLELRFGNADAMVRMIRKIAYKENIGNLLAEGFVGIAAKKPEYVKYIVAVKGMAFASYEPRGFFGMGLAYGTSSRGACHNVGGWTIRDELQSGEYDRFAAEGKGILVKTLQDTRAYIDSLGVCTAARGAMGYTDKPSGMVLEYVTGLNLTPELMKVGERIYNLERLILAREGVTRRDDMLPYRTMNEQLPSGQAQGRVISKEIYDTMLNEYYAARGWDEDGKPLETKLVALSLKDEMIKSSLYPKAVYKCSYEC